MGDYTTCGSCHLAHAVQFALAPRLLQHYDQWVSQTNWLSSLLHSGVAYSLSSWRSNQRVMLYLIQWWYLNQSVLLMDYGLCYTNDLLTVCSCVSVPGLSGVPSCPVAGGLSSLHGWRGRYEPLSGWDRYTAPSRGYSGGSSPLPHTAMDIQKKRKFTN